MREKVDKSKLERFLKELCRGAKGPGTVYITGGASALLHGWRDMTMDVDLKFLPEAPGLFETIPKLKRSLDINVELASPDDFIPALPGWQERCEWIMTENGVNVFHYDFYTQALSKIERNLGRDGNDVRAMIRLGLIKLETLSDLVSRLTESNWMRYPGLDPKSTLKAVATYIDEHPT